MRALQWDAFVPVDIDNGSCGDRLHLTGEYVDWDNDTHFCGIKDAIFTETGAMDTTAPNGRFAAIPGRRGSPFGVGPFLRRRWMCRSRLPG